MNIQKIKNENKNVRWKILGKKYVSYKNWYLSSITFIILNLEALKKLNKIFSWNEFPFKMSQILTDIRFILY